MAKRRKPDDVQVIIPYPRLLELLEASIMVEDLKNQCKQLRSEMSALRYQFMEVLERLRDLQD